jgi:hypothetical protein
LANKISPHVKGKTHHTMNKTKPPRMPLGSV